MELDKIPLWRGDHVPVAQLIEDFAKYLYLPRLAEPSVLHGAIRDGVALLTWEADSFAFADSFDEAVGRYRGLRGGAQPGSGDALNHGLLVRPEVARKQLREEEAARTAEQPSGLPGGEGQPTRPSGGAEPATPAETPVAAAKPKRWHGTVDLDPTRVGRDAAKIAEEVIAHLAGIVGAQVTVTLDIEARVPGGVPDNVVRTVRENSRTLKFGQHGFERE